MLGCRGFGGDALGGFSGGSSSQGRLGFCRFLCFPLRSFGGGTFRSSAFRSSALGSSALGSGALGSGVLGSSVLGSSVLGSSVLGSRSLGGGVLGSSAFRSSVLGSRSLGSRSLGGGVLGSRSLPGYPLGDGPLCCGALGGRALCDFGERSLIRLSLGSRACRCIGQRALVCLLLGRRLLGKRSLLRRELFSFPRPRVLLCDRCFGSGTQIGGTFFRRPLCRFDFCRGPLFRGAYNLLGGTLGGFDSSAGFGLGGFDLRERLSFCFPLRNDVRRCARRVGPCVHRLVALWLRHERRRVHVRRWREIGRRRRHGRWRRWRPHVLRPR